MAKLKFIVSGGGTGGHIFPAISIANALKKKRPDAEFLFVGAEGRMEMERVPNAGYEIKGLPVAGFDRSIEEAAHDLGANEVHTFIRVILPMIAPGVLSGAMLALTLSLDDVVVSFFTAGPDSQTLPLRILSMVKKGVSPDVNALSTLIIIGSVLLLVSTTLIQNKLEKEG